MQVDSQVKIAYQWRKHLRTLKAKRQEAEDMAEY